jgi:predicted ferric reductase
MVARLRNGEPIAGFELLVITPLLAMADAIAARKGELELELHYYVASSRQTAFAPPGLR